MNMKKLVDRFAWEYAGDCPDGKPFYISGINIWEHHWIDNYETIEFECPKNKIKYNYRVYTVKALDKIIKFGTTEYSNCYWGFIEYIDRLDEVKILK